MANETIKKGTYNVYLGDEQGTEIQFVAEAHEIGEVWAFFFMNGQQVAGFKVSEIVGFEKDPLEFETN